MFKRTANQALIQKVTSCCMYIEYQNSWISVVVLTKHYAVTTLHCLPESFQELGQSVSLWDSDGQNHNAYIHGMNKLSDYVVFKKTDGTFECIPEMTYPALLDQYIVVGFQFGEKKASVRLGHVSSLSDGSRGYFYGDSGGLPGFSGGSSSSSSSNIIYHILGGVFYARNGALFGIARGSEWDGKETKQYGDVLEMVSTQIILSHIEFAKHEPFSV
uniref:Serine protease n=1 Tax=Caenorhabditis japonica TaxID=281687 RepID=A0A8R1EA08_CAEJA